MKQKIAALSKAPDIDGKIVRLRDLMLNDPDLDEAAEYRGFIEALWSIRAFDLIKMVDHTRSCSGPFAAINLYKTWLLNAESSRGSTSFFEAEHVAAIWFNLGTEYNARGNFEDKMACYRAALQLRSDFYPAAVNLGLSYEAEQDTDKALALWKRALQSDEARIALLNNMGRVHESRKAFKQAKEDYTRSLLTDPNQSPVIHHLIGLRTKVCDWPTYREDIPGVTLPAMKAATRALTLLAISDDIETQFQSNESWIQEKMSAATPFPSRRSQPRDKIRLGYLSSDFCMHPVTYLMTELIETHDRTRFEVYGFCSTKDDNSDTRRRIVAAFDVFHNVCDLTDEAAARLIYDCEIDILIDLNGLTLGNRLPILRFRPAPIQMTYLGYNGPIPLPELDYIIADRYVIPVEHAHRYWPRPLYMDGCFQVNDASLGCAVAPSRAAAGLPDDAFVFCCFSNTYKITETMFQAWMTILERAPNAVLWLYADNDDASENMRTAALNRGIEVARLIFANRVQPELYRGRLALADLFLDTFPYNAGTTASDALRVGLPILTMSGESFISRMAGSLMKAMGIEKGIVTTLDDYVDFAVAVAKGGHPSLRSTVSPTHWTRTIGDTKAFCVELEGKLEELWRHAIEQQNDQTTCLELVHAS